MIYLMLASFYIPKIYFFLKTNLIFVLKITGYRIRYQVVDCHADRPVGCNESQIFTIITNDSQPHITVPELRKYTNYSISIQAINRKGVSNYTTPIYIKTEEDSKYKE